jgi:hypothetical protein
MRRLTAAAAEYNVPDPAPACSAFGIGLYIVMQRAIKWESQ